ncbi:uncharacterized protein JCM15063_000791 [Sporobolomyces koalae]|uniref:uncharacterized protein n=1 Tax=Sporobolomyces koalae TaxID=500713 RepID=UPI00316EF350
MDGIPLDPYHRSVLTESQQLEYLDRLNLARSLSSSRPSLELLSQLLLSQLEEIAKDTTPLHVPEREWNETLNEVDNVIRLSRAFTGMPEGVGAFDRIVRQRKGAFCFAINATFAALLRSFGFRVSELVARTFKSLGNDPKTHPDGYKWGTMTHEIMLVDWSDSDARYLVDGAWGPWACPVPIKLADKQVVKGLNDYEAFQLVEEVLPLCPKTQTRPIDEIKGWTFSRRINPPGVPISLPISDSESESESTTTTKGYWSPLFHFHLLSIPLLDFRLYHHFSASHELASFTAFWLVTKLIPNSGGARRSMMYADKPGDTQRRAKVYTTGGHEGKGSLEGRDVEYVEMKVDVMREYLKREFGFGF